MTQELPLEDESPEGHRSGFVAVVGRPNAGKSTLMNAFLEDKIAIVTPRPQTTRIRQLGILTTDAYQLIFIDTPGIMKPRHKLDEFMVEVARDSLLDADVVLWLVDANERVGGGDRAIAKQLAALDESIPIVLGMNKSDLLKPAQVIPQTKAYAKLLPRAKWLLFSATEGNGRKQLLDLLANELPEGPRFYPADQVTDSYMRDMAAEFIREQIFLQLRDEIPYGIAVQVIDFKERDNGTTYISANIYVERDNHKRIIIGNKGAQLKQLGAASRKELEELVGGKVFLELWVKIDPQWRQNERSLKRLGYTKMQ